MGRNQVMYFFSLFCTLMTCCYPYGPNEDQIADFKVKLNSIFEMSNLGLFHHYLGIHFWHHEDGGIALSQAKYIETLL